MGIFPDHLNLNGKVTAQKDEKLILQPTGLFHY
jgi:hypothetical protein